jgi:hypothetical protein
MHAHINTHKHAQINRRFSLNRKCWGSRVFLQMCFVVSACMDVMVNSIMYRAFRKYAT